MRDMVNLSIGYSSRIFKSLKACGMKFQYELHARQNLDFLNVFEEIINNNSNLDVYYFLGVTDNSKDEKTHTHINFELPKILLNKMTGGQRLITFGSVMEKSKFSTRYLDSKKKWLNYVIETDRKYTHYQLATLYGIDIPKAGMFLYDLVDAIYKKHDFEMSSGKQKRSYHSYRAVANCIRDHVKKDNGVINLNDNDGLELYEIASQITQRIDPKINIVRNKLALDNFIPSYEEVGLGAERGLTTDVDEITEYVKLALSIKKKMSNSNSSF